MPYIHFTEDQKLRANSVDLVEFLRRQGEKLISSGQDKRLTSDHSITVHGNEWYDHAAERGGHAISFVQNFYGLTYPEAVTRLLNGEQGEVYVPAEKKEKEPPKEFALPPSNQTMRRVYAYLLQQRHISREVLSAFAQKGLIYESRELSIDQTKVYVNTLFMDNEMILTFMMSQAQAESESLSGNVRWGHRKNFKDGKVYYHCKNFLGYRWGADGQPEIDPEQAAIVRRIFSRFLLGHSVRQITTDLMADGIKTATGKTVWHDSVVQKMLCNEKYIGDALLQKTYIADLFTREKRVNNGELPKYYVHDCHPAIIDRETFQKVQEEIARRSSLKKTSSKAKTQLGKYCGKYVLSELLVCGECGSPYRRVIWTQKGAKRVVWRCQNRLEHGRKICKQSPTLDEGDIHDAVISAMNELFRMQAAKDAVKAGIAAVLAGEEQTLSLPAVEHQIRNLQERQLELFQLIVSAGADCTDYDEELQQVYMAKTKLMAQKAELEKEHRGAAAFDSRLAELDMALEQASGALTDFDELTVRQLVSNIKVLDKDSLLICFKDGTEITQTIQRRRSA